MIFRCLSLPLVFAFETCDQRWRRDEETDRNQRVFAHFQSISVVFHVIFAFERLSSWPGKGFRAVESQGLSQLYLRLAQWDREGGALEA